MTNRLQWMLSIVPLIKTLQLSLSFLFWYSCFYSHTFSLWMSFGVYITGIFFQTASFASFLLISHGYYIMCEHLSVQERRITAFLGCLFYLTLVGYKASVPYFTVLLLLNYMVSFSLIFRHISQNLLALQEQLSVIEDEDIHVLYDAVHLKYIMFKKFQIAMQLIAIAETAFFTTEPLTYDPSSLLKYPPTKEIDAKMHEDRIKRREAIERHGSRVDMGRQGPGQYKAALADKASADLVASVKYIPGTKMVFPGLKKPQEHADLIAYLKESTQ